MKNKLSILSFIILVLSSCFLIVGCNSKEYINISKIYFLSALAEANNSYDFVQITLDIEDYKGITYKIWNTTLSKSQIKNNSQTTWNERDYFFPSYENIIPIYNKEYKLKVSMNIILNEESYEFNKIDIITITKENDIIKIKNKDMPALASSMIFNIDLINNTNESFEIILNGYKTTKN